MSSLSEFIKKFPKQDEAANQEELNQKAKQIKENIAQSHGPEFEKTVSDAYQKFGNMDSGQLYQEIFKEAGRLKANGQFDYNALHNAINNMGEYISPQQKEAMLNLLSQIK